MFQLIVAVISIALVAALAIASIYYGGSAFNKSSLKANVTTLVNAGQQISGAVALYKSDNGGVWGGGISNLTATAADGTNYLAGEPGKSSIATGDWSVDATYASIALVGDSTALDTICAEAGKQAGEATGVKVLTDGQFGCTTDAGVTSFKYKL